MKKFSSLFLPVACILLYSCGGNGNSAQKTEDAKPQKAADTASVVFKGDVWAEQVESNTELIKPEGWTEEDWSARFKSLDKKIMLNTILDAVRSGKQKAYDFFTEAEYRITAVDSLLKELNVTPESISLIKVREKLFFDKDKFSLHKQATRMTLCIHKFRADSTVMGDQPLFYVKLNN
jgi:hypothetical protein